MNVIDNTPIDVILNQSATNVIIEQTPTDVICSTIGLQGPQGVQGLPGPPAGEGIEIPFAYGDATPEFLITATANKTVFDVELYITEAFDGVGATLSIGSSPSYDDLMLTTENDPSVIGVSATNPTLYYSVDTSLYIKIVPGAGAEHGKGIIVLKIQQ